MNKFECPNCKKPVDCHQEIHGEEVSPTVGDICACAYCAYLGIVNDDNETVRDMTPEEWEEIDGKTKQQLAFALGAFRLAKSGQIRVQ